MSSPSESKSLTNVIELLLNEINRLCSQYNEYRSLDDECPIEEKETRKRKLKIDTDRVVEKLKLIANVWVKEQALMQQRLLDAVSKLTQCSEKLFPAFATARLKSVSEEINQKMGNRNLKDDNNRRFHATFNVNVNVNIDRNALLAPSNNRNKSPSPTRAPKNTGSPNGERELKFKVNTARNRLRSSSPNASTRAERTPPPSNVTIRDEDRTSNVVFYDVGSTTSSPSSSIFMKAEKTDTHPSVADGVVSSDEKTGHIWMVDGNEDMGGIEPAFDRTAFEEGQFTTSTPRNSPKSTVKGKDSVGKRKVGTQIKKSKHSNRSISERESISVTSSQTQDSANICWFFCSLFVMIAIGFILYKGSCCVFRAWLGATGRFELAVVQIWCEFANEICQQYGWMCSDYCASGFELDAWKKRR